MTMGSISWFFDLPECRCVEAPEHCVITERGRNRRPLCILPQSMRELGMDNPEQAWEPIATAIAEASSTEALEQLRIKLLGRNGTITLLMRSLGDLPADQRRQAG